MRRVASKRGLALCSGFFLIIILIGGIVLKSIFLCYNTPREASGGLQLSVVQDKDKYISTEIYPNQDTDNKVGFSCIGLYDANIVINGDSVDLETALRQGKISLGEIAARAQLDAQTERCTERWESQNSLARFCYGYPEFDLWITNDVYETPDGLQHRIRQITLAQPGSEVFSVYPELDQEDWGIDFFVLEAKPGSITLSYTQSGGQLIGQLVTGNYEISRLNPIEVICPLADAPMQERIQIVHNAQGEITLDLETYFGNLPAGEYGMYLYLQDEYCEEDVPPLTRNYHDMQCYWIEFLII